MKSLKTYNMDHDCINILSPQPNKSQYVCRAVRRLFNNINDVSPADFPTIQLLAALHSREEVSHYMKAQIVAEITSLQSNS